MKTSMKLLAVSAVFLAINGCGKDDEPKVYGVRESKWYAMNDAKRKEAAQRYEHEIRTAERRRIEVQQQEQAEKNVQVQLADRLDSLEKRHQEAALQNQLAAMRANTATGHVPTATTVIIQQPNTVPATHSAAPQQAAAPQQTVLQQQPQQVATAPAQPVVQELTATPVVEQTALQAVQLPDLQAG